MQRFTILLADWRFDCRAADHRQAPAQYDDVSGESIAVDNVSH
ncbi:hypothetical protein [Pseudomonas brassicacearum]|nr:hypothetical protein [Pseudomonas brassicacearum]